MAACGETVENREMDGSSYKQGERPLPLFIKNSPGSALTHHTSSVFVFHINHNIEKLNTPRRNKEE